MPDWLEWLVKAAAVLRVTLILWWNHCPIRRLFCHCFDWHSLARQFTLNHLGLFAKTAPNRLRCIKATMPIMQPLLAMHSTQTWLLLPGNLTGSIQILPFEKNNKAQLCSLISHYCIKRFIETRRKLAFMEIIKLCFEFPYPCLWSRMWRFILKKHSERELMNRKLLQSGVDVVMGPAWEWDGKLQSCLTGCVDSMCGYNWCDKFFFFPLQTIVLLYG